MIRNYWSKWSHGAKGLAYRKNNARKQRQFEEKEELDRLRSLSQAQATIINQQQQKITQLTTSIKQLKMEFSSTQQQLQSLRDVF